MNEIIWQSPDEAFFLSEAARLGFMGPDGKVIITGAFTSGGGWFLAIQGTVYEPQPPTPIGEDPPPPVPRPGYWGRLRINGTPEQMPSFDAAITQYVYQQGDKDTPGGWVNAADGTPAPEWVATVGVIA